MSCHWLSISSNIWISKKKRYDDHADMKPESTKSSNTWSHLKQSEQNSNLIPSSQIIEDMIRQILIAGEIVTLFRLLLHNKFYSFQIFQKNAKTDFKRIRMHQSPFIYFTQKVRISIANSHNFPLLNYLLSSILVTWVFKGEKTHKSFNFIYPHVLLTCWKWEQILY